MFYNLKYLIQTVIVAFNADSVVISEASAEMVIRSETPRSAGFLLDGCTRVFFYCFVFLFFFSV